MEGLIDMCNVTNDHDIVELDTVVDERVDDDGYILIEDDPDEEDLIDSSTLETLIESIQVKDDVTGTNSMTKANKNREEGGEAVIGNNDCEFSSAVANSSDVGSTTKEQGNDKHEITGCEDCVQQKTHECWEDEMDHCDVEEGSRPDVNTARVVESLPLEFVADNERQIATAVFEKENDKSDSDTDSVDELIKECEELVGADSSWSRKEETCNEIQNSSRKIPAAPPLLRVDVKKLRLSENEKLHLSHPDEDISSPENGPMKMILLNKLFYCNVCPWAAHLKRDLNEHKAKYHQFRSYDCNQCDFKAALRSQLNKHKKDKHVVRARVKVQNIPEKVITDLALYGGWWMVAK